MSIIWRTGVWGNGQQSRDSDIQNVIYSFLMLCIHSVTHQIMTISTKRVKSTGPGTTGDSRCPRHSPFLQYTHHLSVGKKNMHRTHGEKPPESDRYVMKIWGRQNLFHSVKVRNARRGLEVNRKFSVRGGTCKGICQMGGSWLGGYEAKGNSLQWRHPHSHPQKSISLRRQKEACRKLA